MKYLLVTLFFALFAAVFTSEADSLQFLEPASEPLMNYKVYSMVWSAKYYNPGEKKTFFFNIPFSFDTQMSLDVSNKNIFLNFINWKQDKGNFNYLIKEKENINKSVFIPLLNFSSDMTSVNISFDFKKNPELEISNLKIYENSFAKSYQVKITKKNDKLKNALYITFDFNKKVIGEKYLKFLEDYFYLVREK